MTIVGPVICFPLRFVTISFPGFRDVSRCFSIQDRRYGNHRHTPSEPLHICCRSLRQYTNVTAVYIWKKYLPLLWPAYGMREIRASYVAHARVSFPPEQLHSHAYHQGFEKVSYCCCCYCYGRRDTTDAVRFDVWSTAIRIHQASPLFRQDGALNPYALFSVGVYLVHTLLIETETVRKNWTENTWDERADIYLQPALLGHPTSLLLFIQLTAAVIYRTTATENRWKLEAVYHWLIRCLRPLTFGLLIEFWCQKSTTCWPSKRVAAPFPSLEPRPIMLVWRPLWISRCWFPCICLMTI